MRKNRNLDSSDADLNSATPAGAIPIHIREQLERILSSRTFRAAEGQRALLRYVVEAAIEGRGAELKEYSVGVEAFQRGESFDPRQDTIVRTEARNVRLRLARYYEEEGKDDSIVIHIPKGGYAPAFLERVPASPKIDSPEIGPAEREESEPADAPIAVLTPAALTPPERKERKPRIGSVWRPAVALPACALIAVSLAYLTRSVTADARPSGDPASIAVLPFRHLSDDRESEILSGGLTEELINSLTRIPDLHVVGRSSVYEYQDKALDIRQAGRKLGVRHVLEGAVSVSGGSVRISAQLEDASNGYHLWSASFDRKLDDTLAIEDEISRAIMQSLGVEMTGAARLKTGASPNPAAYQDYLTGLYFLNKSTGQNIRTAISHFERAAASDPGFALAYHGVGDAYSRLAAFTSTPSEEVIPKIRAAASKALELDDTLGEAHLDLARADTFEWNWAAADREFHRALELSPSSGEVHRYYGDYLIRAGYLDQALAEGRISLDLDPISPSAAQFVARALYFLRRYDEAIDQLHKTLAAHPNDGILHQALALAYLASPSTYAQGVKESEIAHQFMEADAWTTGQLGYAYALTGKTKEAREVLKELTAGSSEHVRSLPVARVYIGLGDRERALEWLRKAVDEHDVALFLKADPLYDGLRGDPRFVALRLQSKLSASAEKE
jgi:TolB-like protein/Flp pilus assembly protein TadD